MKKKQIQSRQKRKHYNQMKAPIFKYSKAIEHTKRSIKTNIIVLIIAFLFSLLVLFRIIYNTNYKLWIESEIIYQSHYYIPKSYAPYGFSSGGYYIIIDDQQIEWRVSGSFFELDEMLEGNIDSGDKLKIYWHYWLFDRYVRSIESNGKSLRSFDKAKAIAKGDRKPSLIILSFSLEILIISVICLIKKIRLKSKYKINLNYAEEQLNRYIEQQKIKKTNI